MAEKNQATRSSEREISVDLNAADPEKAVTRTKTSDIAAGVRDDADTDRPRTKSEKEIFKRMGRLERNLDRQFNQRMADREAEWQRERSELLAKIDKVGAERDSGPDAADAAHEAAIQALKEKLEAAHEKGDSRAAADITLQISQLDAKYWAKKASAAGQTTRATAADTATTQRQEGKQKAATGPTRAGARFIAANEEWWDDPKYSVEQFATNGIYLELVNTEGFDAKSDETYKEVSKRLRQKFPDLPVAIGAKDPGDDDEDDEEEARHEVANERQAARRAGPASIQDRGSAAGARNNGSRRTLSKQDIETMKACRLDPDNDKDVVAFLKEAVQLDAQQA